MTAPDTERFESLPLAEQLQSLDEKLAGSDPRELLALCADLRDAAPLSWLVTQLLGRGWLGTPTAREWFATFVGSLPDTSVHKVLRDALASGARRDELRDTLLAALHAVSIERLSTMCLLDRALKHNFQEARDAHVEGVVEACRQALAAGDAAVPLAQLAQVPARTLPLLWEAASTGGVRDAFETRRAELARRAIEILGDAPKAVSQANAEELLARRVYTDPGHFLIELLQNAEDAGATIWRVDFGRDAVTVWHNGTPFDAKDLVGVTSIGQTTKRKQQIGFFGVGFKSVYEITDRPRIYSDVYRFEIADVSIPKYLGERPADVAADGTVLILPLRDATDPVRSPRALFEKARALDPCVLITLAGIDEIHLTLAADAGGPVVHRLVEAVDEGRASSIRQEPQGWSRSYLLRSATPRFGGGAREAGRADTTTVLVGVQVDDGVPVPCGEAASTVYSYLPTAETSGLRFFVQAHFDVPVDRERVTQDSAWNRWILDHVPGLLAEVVSDIGSPAAAAGLLDVLPLGDELASALFKPVAGGLRRAFRGVDLLPDHQGRLRPAEQVVLADPAVAGLLGDGPLPDGRTLMALPEAPPAVNARRLEVAAWLGARKMDVAALLEGLDEIARGREAAWFLRLHDLVLGEIESLERAGAALQARGLVLRLRRMRIVPDAQGTLHAGGADGPGMPAPTVRALFDGIRPLVHAAVDSSERSQALLERLGVPRLGLEQLVEALGAACDASLAPWEDRLDAVLHALCEAPASLRSRAAALPVFPTARGERTALSGGGRDGAVMLTDPRLRGLYLGRRPFLEDQLGPGTAAFVACVDVAQLNAAALVDDLEGGLFPRTPETLREVHAVLEAVRDDLNARSWKRLAECSIWPDRDGAPRSLRGSDAVRVPVHESLTALFEAGSWMDLEVSLGAHLADAGVAVVGADAVVDALERGAAPEFVSAASAWLVTHGGRLGAGSRDRLAAAPAWLDDRGTLRPLDQLYHPGASGRALYERAGGTHGFVAQVGPSFALLEAMGLGARLRRLTAGVVIEQVIACGAQVEERSPVARHPVLSDAAARRWLYAMLRTESAEVFSDRDTAARLRDAPLFVTTRGTLLAPRSLVLDDRLPDLGVDWLPHEEVPRDVLELLRRHLDVGRPPLTEIVETHLRPALDAAAAAGDGERSVRLLEWLASEATNPDTVRTWLQTVSIEANDGTFVSVSALCLPSTAVAPWVEAAFGSSLRVPSPRLGAGPLTLLRAMGLPERPRREALAAAMLEPGTCARGVAFAALLSERSRAVSDGLDGLPVASAAWLPDGTGIPRKPGDLFSPSPEVEALIGHDPASYPHADAWRQLDEQVRASLGLRSVVDVRLPEVLAHIERSRGRRVPVLLRVYEWMERGLEEGWLSSVELQQAAAAPLICADDGEFYEASRVVGELAFRLFGAWRGYWERGAQRCPRLCRALGIVAEVRSRDIAGFLREVGERAQGQGAQSLLASDPALPRMLLACYARLGGDEAVRLVPRSKPLVLAHCNGVATLVGASEATLYRSDTPTLEALFQGAGTLHLAAKGPVEDRAEIDAFMDAVGVRLLREKYRVFVVRSSGREVTEEKGRELAALRATLRALGDVLARVQLHRRELRETGWVYDARLRPLATTGSIRVIENLAVRYTLPGVGSAESDAASAYDPVARTLFVEARVAADVPGHATGLALGLLGCIYDGPGESQLLDIVELLLGRRTRAAMDANLDQKHYPRARVSHTVADSLSERIGELLDYGLDRRLARRFEELDGVDLSALRDGEALARAVGGAADEDRAALARRVAPHLLESVGVTAPSAALLATLVSLLEAPSLTELPAALTESDGPDLAPLPTRTPAQHTSGDARPRRFAELDALLATFDPAKRSSTPDPTPTEPLDDDPIEPRLPSPTPRPLPAQARWRADRAADELAARGARSHPEPAHWDRPEPDVGLLDRVVRWFGFGDEEPEPPQAPQWATNSNPLAAIDQIGPQLWATPSARREVARRSTTAALVFDPPRLPVPFMYAVQVIGTQFDADTQSWLPGQPLVGGDLAPQRPRGQRVVFEGRVEPGRSQLPMPLHSRLHAAPSRVGGGELRWQATADPARLEIDLDGDEAAHVRYEVELSGLPRLAHATGGVHTPAQLTTPTMDRHAFPIEVWRFVEEQGHRASLWERAVAVQTFVQRRYLYDDAFLERADVRAAMRKLRDRDNHHLQVLHASAGDSFLGRGICYELNTMVVELCRHLDVPAMVATGWVLDAGRVDRPDHLFALAVLPSPDGACLYPLDAATGDAGPRRPLALVPTGPQTPAPPSDIGWAVPAAARADVANLDEVIDDVRREEELLFATELSVLEAALDALGVRRGATQGSPVERIGSLRRTLGRALGSEAAVEVLLRVARGGARYARVTPELELLAGRGLVRVHAEEVFEVTSCLT